MCRDRRGHGDERGVALVIALLAMLLMAALGMALTTTTMVESRVSTNHRDGIEALYAAEGAMSLAVQEALSIPDWNALLAGVVGSSLVDGAPGVRTLSDGSTLDLQRETSMLRCGLATCTAADMDAYTAERPWGPNNPRWQPFAHAPFADVSPGAINSAMYVVVWIADDSLENDALPLTDGDETAGPNPGRGTLSMIARAYGPRGVRRAIEATLVRTPARTGVISWREAR